MEFEKMLPVKSRQENQELGESEERSGGWPVREEDYSWRKYKWKMHFNSEEKQRERDTQVFLNCQTAKENLRQNVHSPRGEMLFYRKTQFLGYSYHRFGKQGIVQNNGFVEFLIPRESNPLSESLDSWR